MQCAVLFTRSMRAIIPLAVCLALPSPARPGSELAALGAPSAAAHRPATARARVNFKVVIPAVLSLSVSDAVVSRAFAATVDSSGHVVALATTRAGGTAPGAAPAAAAVRFDAILVSAARRSLAQTPGCTPLAAADRTICTVSMP